MKFTDSNSRNSKINFLLLLEKTALDKPRYNANYVTFKLCEKH